MICHNVTIFTRLSVQQVSLDQPVACFGLLLLSFGIEYLKDIPELKLAWVAHAHVTVRCAPRSFGSYSRSHIANC